VSLAPAGRVPRWSSELLGGATGAVVMLAVVITLGLLAYAPLGLAQAPLGVTASLATAGVGGLVFALAGGRGLPVSGPSSATALIFAGLLAQLTRDPQWQADPAGTLAPVLAAAGVAVSLAGLLQVALGLLRLGRLAQYVPQPVLAGFMNGVSLLILLAQLPVLTGIGIGGGFQPATLALGLGTAGATWAVARRWPAAPAQLIGLGLGLAVYVLLHTRWPGLVLGPQVGPVPQGLPLPSVAWQLLAPGTAAFLARHLADVLTTAAVLALIGALESVLSALALERQVGARARPDAMLLAPASATWWWACSAGCPACCCAPVRWPRCRPVAWAAAQRWRARSRSCWWHWRWARWWPACRWWCWPAPC